MRLMRLAAAAVAVVLGTLAAPLAAQNAPPKTPASQPAAEPILKVIPSGTLGYVVLQNVKGATDDVDTFLKYVGATELMKDAVPEGVLKALLAELPVGDGLNPNGGLAIAMLDPAPFGIDLVKMMKLAIPGAGGATTASAPPDWTSLPVVLFVPGSGVKEVFGKLNPTPADPYMKISMDGVDLYAAPLGSYVLLSPNAKALEAVARAPKKADDELKGRHAQVVRGSALAVRLDLKAISPVVLKALKALDLLTEAKAEGLVDNLPEPLSVYTQIKPMLGLYTYLLPQIAEVTFGLRFAPTGVLVEGAVTYLPDSVCAKALAAVAAPQAPLLDLLPNQSCAMAVGLTVWSGPAAREIHAKNIEAQLANPALAKLPEAVKKKIQQVWLNLAEEISAVAVSLGGVPDEAKGAFGVTVVLKGKDAEKIKALLAEAAVGVTDAIKAAAGDDEELAGIKITYEKAVDKAGDVPVDSLVVKAPPLENDMVGMVLTQIFGEGGLSPLVATADKNTIVLTLGGGKESMTKALQAAAGKEEKKILADKETAAAMKFLPKNCEDVGLLNVGNYFDLMMAAARKMGAGAGELPFSLTCKTPIVFGSGVEADAQVWGMYVPSDVVKDVIGFFKSMGAMRGGGTPDRPVPGGEEF